MLKRARYPLRRSKFANHLYNDRQHVIMLVLRQHFRMPYRQFCETMEVCNVLTGEIGLSRVPHFTTLQKFSARMDIRRLERFLLAFLEDFRPRSLFIAVDSTGYSSTCASDYYTRIVERQGEGPGPPRKNRRVRRHVKETLAVETKKQIILAVKFRLGPANDSPDFIRVLRKVRMAGSKVSMVVADKGYDSEGNHEYVHEVLGGRSVIPIRRGDDPRLRVRGRYRREQWKHFDSEAYKQRVMAETVNSVQKRTMGSHVLARKIGLQHTELVFRALAYNVRRVENFLSSLLKVFYTAETKKDIYINRD